MIFSILVTVAVLGVLIIIHEFGHFIACRMTGVGVEKFSIGFGPQIARWKGKETEYVVSLFLFGGYVKPQGESVSEVENEEPKKGDYLAAPLFSRIVIVVAGVVMNYLLAFVLFFLVAVFSGKPAALLPVIGGFVEGYPAAESGLQKGDVVLKVNEEAVATWWDMTKAFQASASDTLNLLIQRKTEAGSEEILPITLTAKQGDVVSKNGDRHEGRLIGIKPSMETAVYEKVGVFEGLYWAAAHELKITLLTHQAIFGLITGRQSIKEMAGPIGIVALTGDAAKRGFVDLVNLTALLSISLAVINLLPIPALDGGHLFFLLIEAVRRKKVSLVVQERATQVGFTLLIALIIFICYNDLVNLKAFDKIAALFGS